MKVGFRLRFTRQMVIRIIADALMVSTSLLVALVLRYLWQVAVEGSALSAQALWQRYARLYLSSVWPLTMISIIVFHLSGFYTRSRIYHGRYKALVIVQAVSLSYLVFSLLLFLFWDGTSFPRSAFFLAWIFELVLVLGVRFGPVFWRTFSRVERRLWPTHSTEGEIDNVLVIGGAGYIGSALVQRLLELQYKVRVLDLLIYGDASLSKFSGYPNFELMQGDFRHINTVVKATKDMDAIVHLGAIVGDSACSVDEDVTMEINLRATRTIAEVGKGFGVARFVFASTCSVYGASDELLDERSVLRPISLYARTKLESEELLLALADEGFSPTILRFGTVYGLSGRPRFDLVVNLLAAKAVQDGEAGIFGGEQWRPLVHVRDVAEATVLTLQAPLHNVRGEVFNVGSNEQNHQIMELGEMIKELVPAARIAVIPGEDNRNYRVCFDKICNQLGFRPRYTVRDGVNEIVDAFAAGEITDYRDPRYSNSMFLKLAAALQPISTADLRDRDRIRISTTDAVMLADGLMDAMESQSPESMRYLHQSLVQVILGDIDGCISTLVDRGLVVPTVVPTTPAAGHPVRPSHPSRRKDHQQSMPS